MIDDIKKRFKRYENALAIRQQWETQFGEAYKFMLPTREPLVEKEETSIVSSGNIAGDDRTIEIYNPTGEEAIYDFSNNMQVTMMPAFKQWVKLICSTDLDYKKLEQKYGQITEATIDSIKKQLAEKTNTLFYYFDKANLSSVINESLQDLAISTGVLLVNKGTFDNPFQFESVPANQVIIEGGMCQSLKNFWRPMRVKARDLKEKWPDIQLTTEMENKVKNSPDEKVFVIEHTLYYPNEDKKKYFYGVMDGEGKHQLLEHWLEYDPWTAFRGNKAPGEVYGRGPALTALPFVRVLNKMSQYDLEGIAFASVPIFLASNNDDLNPYTVQLEPGSIIPVSPSTPLERAFQRLDTGSGPTYLPERIERLETSIKNIMFANPVNPENMTNETATKVSIVNNNWIRKNSGFFERLAKELFPVLVEKCLKILQEFGLISKLEINGKEYDVSLNNPFIKLFYTTPLDEMQTEAEVKAIDQAVVWSQQTFGGMEGLLALNFDELPESYFERINLPTNLINYDFKNSPLVKSIKGLANGQGQPTQNPAVAGNPASSSNSQQLAQALQMKEAA